MMHAKTAGEVLARRKTFLAKWKLRYRPVATSLEEAGERLFTFVRYPPEQWRSSRTTNAIERLHEEFKRPIKTQCLLPCAETAAMLSWALLASVRSPCAGSTAGRPSSAHPPTLTSPPEPDHHAFGPAPPISTTFATRPDMLSMTLPSASFDGVFANAVLFHVPSRALPGVLDRLHAALKPDGVLLVSNPRGQDEEGFVEGRYACFYSFDSWRRLVSRSGFALVDHYYRPPGKPRSQQPWLATLWRKSASPGERGAP